MSRAWTWLRANWRSALAALGGFVLLMFGASWAWRRRGDLIGRLRDRATVAEAQRDIATIGARRQAIDEQSAEYADQIAAIDVQLASARRRAVEAHQTSRELTDEEVAEAFGRLGYLIPLVLSVRWLATTLACALLLMSSMASADCPETGVHAAPRRLELVQQGEPGIWFRSDVARCLLDDVALLPALREQGRLLELRAGASDEHGELLIEARDLAIRQASIASANLEAAVMRMREAEEDRDSWTRSPWLWAGIGLVGTVALEVAGVLLVSSLD